MNSSIVHRPAMELVVARAEPYPDGVHAAFELIESRLSTLKGRKFFGLAYDCPEGVEYFAGLLTTDQEEQARLGLPTLEVAEGEWGRVRLKDWQQHIEDIGGIVRELVERHGRDGSRPVLEYYRSEKELEILVPV